MPAWALPRKNLRREVMTFPKKVVFARMQLALHFVVMPIRLQDAANVSRAHDLAMTREQGASGADKGSAGRRDRGLFREGGRIEQPDNAPGRASAEEHGQVVCGGGCGLRGTREHGMFVGV